MNYYGLTLKQHMQKLGYDYRGAEYTESIIRQWIESYGDKIHEFAGRNPKYAHLLEEQ